MPFTTSVRSSTPAASAPEETPVPHEAAPGTQPSPAKETAGPPTRQPLSRLSRLLPPLLAPASGLLLAAAFPPFHTNGGTAWLALIPLFWLIRRSAPGRAARLGLAAGAAFWIATLCWFPAIIKNNGPWFLVLIGWAGLAAACGTFWALFAAASARAWRWAGDAPGWRRLLTLAATDPLLWVGAEWIRSWIFTGFAWNFLGVSQSDNPPLIQTASLAGVYAVSVLIVWSNEALTSMAERMLLPVLDRLRRRSAPPLPRGLRLVRSAESLAPFLLILLCWGWGAARVQSWQRLSASAPSWRIALIQPDAPCVFEGNLPLVRQKFRDLQEQTHLANLARPDLVVWPETATPGSVPDDDITLSYIRQSIPTNGAPLLTGTVENGPSNLSYNAAWLFAPGAVPLGRYRKQHLVPFGEYIPFDKDIPALQRLAPTGVSCTPGDGPGLLTLSNPAHADPLRIGPLICFEDTVPTLSRAAVRSGARLLALMTNDAWFNGSCEPLQHQMQAVLRAVENGVPMVRVGNSGVTCSVTPVGEVRRLEADGQVSDFSGFMTAQVPVPPSPLPAPYTRFGDWPLAIPGALLLLLLLLPRRRPPEPR